MKDLPASAVQEGKMKKIQNKIIVLVISCLLILGISMSILSIMQLRAQGQGDIAVLEEKMRGEFDRMSKNLISLSLSIVEQSYSRIDELGEEAAMEEAKEYLRHLGYGEDGYVFVYDSEGMTVVMLGQDIEGTSRWDLQDSKGAYLVRDLVAAAKAGTGFTEYYFPKPGETEALPKRSYTTYFAPWDWAIGTGNYIDDIDNLIMAEQAEMDRTLSRVTMIILLADLGIILVAAVLALYIGRKIAEPVVYLAREAGMIAEGDLSRAIKVSASDETGALAEAFNNMILRLKEIMINISHAADIIGSSATEMSDASRQVAEGANEQASSAQEISASMEQLSANIQQNTDHSSEANRIVSQAAGDADASGRAVEDAVESMKFISGKIGIIEEIARNTNLLALNAAIEAARAGEAGKGFAVVASEVRKLAENSQKAASDITQVSAESTQKADRTREMMANMVPTIKKSASIAEEILEGSREQATGAEQINTALMQMDKVIQSNASSSEQIAAMAQELKSRSRELNDSVSFFHIGDSEDTPEKPPEDSPLLTYSEDPEHPHAV